MSNRRSIVPPPGNPMHAPFIMFALFFPAMMIGFGVYVVTSGAPLGSAVGILYLLGLVAVISLGALAWGGRSIERERRSLSTAEAWASWRLTEEEHRHFVRAEWRHKALWIAGLFATGLGLPLLLSLGAGDARITALVGAISLAILLLALAAEMPPLLTNERTRQVTIGANAVEVMGRYTQLRGSTRGLEAVGLLPGDPPVLVFRTYVGNRRSYEVRVPVPADHVEEARQVVDRFAPTLPAGESYPELLRRTRAQRAT